MYLRYWLSVRVGALLLAVLAGRVMGQAAMEPRMIFDPAAPGAAEMISPNENSKDDIRWEVTGKGVDLTVPANPKTGYPGIYITPKKPWDASGFGHAQVTATNNGTKPVRLNLSLINEGPWQQNPTSVNIITIKPGKTVNLITIFGYSYAAPGYALKPEAIIKALIFCGKSDVEQKIHIDGITVGGVAGEKPYVDPNSVAVKPNNGVLLGAGVTPTVKQIVAKGAKAVIHGEGIAISFAGGKDPSMTYKPVAGMWNLNSYLQVRIKVKNTGAEPCAPGFGLVSRGGPTPVVVASPIAPGGEAEVVIPFAAATPWRGLQDPAMLPLQGKKEWLGSIDDSGTTFAGNNANGLQITPGASGNASLQLESIVAEMPAASELPAWLGQRPPVEGEWTKTFEDNFDGNAIDLTKWNIYTRGDYHIGAKNHFSKDNVIVKDGLLRLRVEKKHGHHCDDPTRPENDYATGYADTFGKWTQRYGYYEARMKFPTAPSMFFAFWMMPDRGLGNVDKAMAAKWGDANVRADTKDGGMEFDIMEALSIWGPNRHDFGMHWDGYQKYHKSTGTFGVYTQPDKDGFVTCGMLWLPGQVIFYENGHESGRWEVSRVGNQQSYFILDLVTGGWESEPLDDKKLPQDFVFDYVRAWQRKDLATPADGVKPNDGGPFAPLK